MTPFADERRRWGGLRESESDERRPEEGALFRDEVSRTLTLLLLLRSDVTVLVPRQCRARLVMSREEMFFLKSPLSSLTSYRPLEVEDTCEMVPFAFPPDGRWMTMLSPFENPLRFDLRALETPLTLSSLSLWLSSRSPNELALFLSDSRSEVSLPFERFFGADFLRLPPPPSPPYLPSPPPPPPWKDDPRRLLL